MLSTYAVLVPKKALKGPQPDQGDKNNVAQRLLTYQSPIGCMFLDNLYFLLDLPTFYGSKILKLKILLSLARMYTTWIGHISFFTNIIAYA